MIAMLVFISSNIFCAYSNAVYIIDCIDCYCKIIIAEIDNKSCKNIPCMMFDIWLDLKFSFEENNYASNKITIKLLWDLKGISFTKHTTHTHTPLASTRKMRLNKLKGKLKTLLNHVEHI